jgi:acetylserotonin O-methyltransferase
MTPPDVSSILDLIEAFRRSKTMFTAVSLGVFDALSRQPAGVSSLASQLECNADALGRLLDGCVGLGLLTRAGGQYLNAPNAEKYLTSASPDSLAGYVIYSDRTLYPLWTHLDDAVREGTNRWKQTFGSRDTLFEHFFRDEEAKRTFLSGMHGFGQISSNRLIRTFDLSKFRSIVDLGGASGHLCIAACQAYPHLQATVFDLSPVQPFAEEQIAAAGLSDRIKFVPGDFFNDDLPPADLYFLGRILHDWDEAKIGVLLRKIYAALPSAGGILIAEALLDDDMSGPVYPLMQSLNMLICTDGKERNCAGYRALLDAAGFRSVQCRRTGTILDLVLARKPWSNSAAETAK